MPEEDIIVQDGPYYVDEAGNCQLQTYKGDNGQVIFVNKSMKWPFKVQYADQIVTPPLLSKAYCQLKHLHYAQIDEDSTEENFCSIICRSYKPPPMIIYCAYCLQRAQDLYKHRLFCYHDVRHRFSYVFYLYEEGVEVQDEAQQTIICCQGPYKLKTWRYGQVAERFPPVAHVLRDALEEIFYNNQANGKGCKALA